MTKKQIEASRANGAKSHGPITEEGRKRSSQNAIKYGIYSELAVINGESQEMFQNLRQSYLDRFQPFDPVELDMVEQMVAATWRTHRLWSIEAEIFNDAMDEAFKWLVTKGYEPGSQIPPHAALGLAAIQKERSLANLGRQEARLTRLYNHAFETLLKLKQLNQGQKNEPGEPADKDLPVTQPAEQPSTQPSGGQPFPLPTSPAAVLPTVHSLRFSAPRFSAPLPASPTDHAKPIAITEKYDKLA